MKINEVRGVIADAIIGYRCLTVLQQDTPDVSDETIEIMQAISEDAHADADAILSALEAKGMVIEQGWMPIETAPKDGTRVLLAVKPSGTIENWYGRTPPDVDGFGIFKHLDNGWSTPGSGGWDDFFFSGWRPLPEPPAMLSATDGEAGGG